MKFLVVGVGSIGKRRIEILNGLGIDSVDICDPSLPRLEETSGKYKVKKSFTGLKEALKDKPDVAVICTPPVFHIPLAKLAAASGVNLILEKPLAHNLDGVDELIKIIRANKVIAGVAYTLHFHKGVNLLRDTLNSCGIGRVYSVRAECGQYLPDWHPWEDYRNWYMSKKKEGGGAILDISHEIDYLRWFFGDVSEVGCFYGKVSSLEMDADDMSEIILKFKNGIIGSIHLDLLQRTYRRYCEIIGENGTILWDYTAKEVKVFKQEKGAWESIPYKDERSEMFINETKYFIECFKEKKQPAVSVEDGARTLAVALAAKESGDNKKIVSLK